MTPISRTLTTLGLVGLAAGCGPGGSEPATPTTSAVAPASRAATRAPAGDVSGKSLGIVFTGNVWGELEPCG